MSERALFVNEYAERCIDNNINFALERSLSAEDVRKFTYENLREVVNIFCALSLKILFIFYGFFQFSIIWDYFLKVFRTDNIITFLTSLILGFFPFVGTICGIYGSHVCWGWSLFHATFIFLLPYFIVNGPIQMIILYEVYKDIKRWKSEKKCKTKSNY